MNHRAGAATPFGGNDSRTSPAPGRCPGLLRTAAGPGTLRGGRIRGQGVARGPSISLAGAESTMARARTLIIAPVSRRRRVGDAATTPPRWWGRSRSVRRWLRRTAVAVGVLSLTAGTAVVWLFSTIDLPSEPVQPRASILLYADATTELARVGIVDRSPVSLASVPEHVRRAVLAAEDRAFYDHAGVSAKGVLRAIWTNAVEGGRQGASTITQQYVRNAYLTLDQTVTRKVREAVLALKIERRHSKDTILERYLNTIYFGRGAFGIEAAGRAYFGIGVDRLTPAQGAVLAAVIKDPTGLDPANDPQRAKERWRWIIDAMVGSGWLDPDRAAIMPYPVVAEPDVDGGSPVGHIIDRVEHELKTWGISAQVVRTAGLRITTTIDVATQRAVVDAARSGRDAMRGEPDAAVVALEPGTGSVRGYYAGEHGRGFLDNALAARPPGRLFHPVVLAEALSQGIALGSRWNGRSPQVFPDRGVPLYNRHDQQCPSCRLDEALRSGIDTVLYAVAQRVGPERVARRARVGGVSLSYADMPSLVDAPNEPRPGRTRAEVALGRYPVSAADLASVYATFAAAGRHVTRHFVVQTRSAYGQVLTGPAPPRRTAMSAAVAADVSSVLAVPAPDTAPSPGPQRLGVGSVGGPANRPAAAAFSASVPAGDSSHVAGAWCARYVPELAVVGWLGHDPPRALADPDNQTSSTASTVCRRILAGALAGHPVSPLPAAAHVGRTDVGNAGDVGAAPTRTPAPSPTATTAVPIATADPPLSAATTGPTDPPTPDPTPSAAARPDTS
jgi:membrane peptidoglycan carboxypeptidase